MVKHAKIEYKPISVRDLLVEVKDISELMLDLAYSSALFHSEELADEVLELEERVDTLTYMLDMNLMLAARDAEDAENLAGVSRVASAAEKISDAAADIAMIVKQNIGIHPIIRAAFERVEERIVRVEVKSNSVIVGRRFSELELAANIGVDIIGIRRNKEWIINPEEDEIVKEGDVLIARGTSQGVIELKEIAEGTRRKIGD